MAYRRRQGQLQTINTKPTTSEEEEDEDDRTNSDSSSSTSLAAKAIRASSAAHRDSSLSSAYGFNIHSPSSASPSTVNTSTTTSSSSFPKDSKPLEYTSMKNLNESSKQGFWGTLARKAKSFIDDENDNYASPPPPQQLGSLGTGKPTHHVTYSPPPQQLDSLETGKPTHHVPYSSTKPKYQNPYPSRENYRKTDSPKLQKGLNAISSSLNYIGNAVEEGLTIVESRTADIIQETRKHIRKKPSASSAQNQATNGGSTLQQHQLQTHMQPQIQTDQELQLKQTHMQPQIQTDQELQLKASRDVAMAMAAKAKLLLRELKTVKADLAFAKERCGQLEEENKILREHRERGDSPEDDDMIRLQLETLLSEKARLAHENSVYARENRFLREVVEYHQLTMQDVVYLDESTEEVTEVYPIKVVSNAQSQPSLSPEASLGSSLQTTRDIYPHPVPPPGLLEVPKSATSFNLNAATNAAPDTEHNSSSSG